MVFCAMRSASSRVDDGSLTPALMTTSRRARSASARRVGCGSRSVVMRGSFPWLCCCTSRRGAGGAGEQREAEVAERHELLVLERAGHRLGDVPGVLRADAALGLRRPSG